MKKIFFILMAMFMLYSCKKVAVTGRNQINFIGDERMNAMADQQYGMVLDQSKVITGTQNAEMVARCGERIEKAVVRYMKAEGLYNDIANWEWEYNLIDQNVANAWAMPGGKIAFYTGILPITKDETGLAVVMGHEIAHAIARHGAERMSTQMGAQVLTIAAAIAAGGGTPQQQQTFQQAIGIGTGLGILAFSRKHESEADRMGLIFMAMAGYNPGEAVDFWKRMAEMSGGQAPPEFISTHPSNERRIADLEYHMREALRYYDDGEN